MIFSRGVLTDDLLEHLERVSAADIMLIGDGYAPEDGGWSDGQPGRGKFVPYAIVSTGQGSPGQREPLGAKDASWVQAYSLRYVGGSRQQTDWAADRGRVLLDTYAPRNLPLSPTKSWRVQQVQFTSLGAISRNDTVEPPYWECVDAVNVWLEREP